MRCSSCDTTATEIYPLTGAPLCPRHAGALRTQIVRLTSDTETMVKHLAAGYLPEMRDHDLAMLSRIINQDIPEDERVELRLHLAARKVAAHIAQEERLANAVA